LQRKCLIDAAVGDGRHLPTNELRTRIQHIQQLHLLLPLLVLAVLPRLVLQVLLLLLVLLHAERYHP
jgi:hypothetical protein